MAQFEQHFVQDLTQQIKVRHCGSIVFNADNESNVVSVRLFNGSEPVAISGSVVGAVVCSDGSTVPLTGSYSGNTASITLTGDCFAVLGQIGVGIQIVNGTQKTTVLKVIYNVETLTTENVVDPGSRITLEVGDLIAAIDEAVATIPEDYSALTSEVEDIKAVNKIFNRDVVGVPNPIDTATWIDNANLNDSGAVKAAQGWKVTQGYIETSADSYKISYNNSETSYIVQVAGYTSNGSFVRMFSNADSSSGVRSFTIDTTSVDKIRIATRYGNPILSVYPNDGKIVEKLASVEDDVSDLKSATRNATLTNAVKTALLQIAAKVAYIDDQGQDYYDALQEALYPTIGLDSISAVYTQSGYVLTTDTLDSLKPDLVVTAHYEDSTSEVVTTYTLSGTLTVGTSTITITYGGKTTTFNVTVTTDTTAEIAQEDKYLVFGTGSSEPSANTKEHAGITVKYTLDTATTVLHPAGVIVQDGLFEQNKGCMKVYNGDTYVNYVDEINRWAQAPAASYTEFNSKSWNINAYDTIEFSVDVRYLDDSYMYDYTSGKIFFAGKNTRYFGMSNVSEA